VGSVVAAHGHICSVSGAGGDKEHYVLQLALLATGSNDGYLSFG
jgi:hypothetical protein